MNNYSELIEKIKKSDWIADNGDFYVYNDYQCLLDNVNDSEIQLSIVIPTVQRRETLVEAVNSAINQKTNVAYEIVIIDNSGYDICADYINDTVCEIKKLNSNRIRYFVNETRLDSGLNWNVCIQMAQSNWICMIHDDDVISPDLVEVMHEHLQANSDIAYLGCKNIDFRSDAELKEKFKGSSIYHREKHYDYMEFMYDMPVKMCGACFRKDYALAIGGFENDSKMQDYTFTAKYAYQYNVYYIDNPLYAYRISEGQDSANNDMNTVRRVADYQLMKSIAKTKNGLFRKLYLDSCRYYLKKRIDYYNSDSNYEGLDHRIDYQKVCDICEIPNVNISFIEKVIYIGLHQMVSLKGRMTR